MADTQTQVSGKLIILGIMVLAVMAVAASWLFRYSATHRAVQFWDSYAAQLIRDAPTINLVCLEATDDTKELPMHFRLWSGAQVKATEYYDVSRARGVTHLRNALLEDRSYIWPPRENSNPINWRWMLNFRDDSQDKGVLILFSEDCSLTSLWESDYDVISCQPISKGLSTMFTEFATKLPPAH